MPASAGIFLSNFLVYICETITQSGPSEITSVDSMFKEGLGSKPVPLIRDGSTKEEIIKTIFINIDPKSNYVTYRIVKV